LHIGEFFGPGFARRPSYFRLIPIYTNVDLFNGINLDAVDQRRYEVRARLT
jgi:hypothetical protein